MAAALKKAQHQTGNPEDLVVRALHVIVDKTQADKASKIMQNIYSFSSKNFPLGITMRFIPHALRVKYDKLPSIAKWKERQQTFLKAIEDTSRPMVATSWEIASLDDNIPGFGSLRQNIMGINSKIHQQDALFLSVDRSFFRQNEILFSFLPRHETEARAFVSNIVPYFQHKYKGQYLHQLFYEEAIIRARQSIWNADTEEVVSPADLYIEQSGEINDNFDMLEVMGIERVPIDKREREFNRDVAKVERLFSGEDSISAGTLFTNDQQNNTTTISRTQESVGNKSACTTLTREEFDQNITKLSTEVDEIKSMLQKILNATTLHTQWPSIIHHRQFSMQLQRWTHLMKKN
jgi:hypothetical protein